MHRPHPCNSQILRTDLKPDNVLLKAVETPVEEEGGKAGASGAQHGAVGITAKITVGGCETEWRGRK